MNNKLFNKGSFQSNMWVDCSSVPVLRMKLLSDSLYPASSDWHERRKSKIPFFPTRKKQIMLSKLLFYPARIHSTNLSLWVKLEAV